ncbi:hypothetical protein TM1040_3824 (plasmid) [Ruegeria sp. TM1040]|nr:hypothetical protein TM1040_3824 [Ruegeria sp. TM1040]
MIENLRLFLSAIARLLAFLIPAMVAGQAGSCLAPVRPFVPSDSQASSDFADIIRRDFEAYIKDVQQYFHCLERERARAFEEAGEVSQDYGRFLELVGD